MDDRGPRAPVSLRRDGMTATDGSRATSAAIADAVAQAARQKARKIAVAAAVIGLFALLSAIATDTSLRGVIDFFPGFARYLDRVIPDLAWATLGSDVAAWFARLPLWLSLLVDTVAIAFLSTLLAIPLTLLLCFPASFNLNRRYWLYFLCRRLLEIFRGVPELVYALVFVYAFGLGPLAGVMAITIHTVGALGKLFSEVNENVDPGSLEGLEATGAGWWEVMRHGVVPQVLPNYLSYALLRFEINVRGAAIIGIVGAGGIGQELMGAVRMFAMTEISAIVILIMILVSLIDMSCENARLRIVGMRG